jgi:hypothetical protein
MNIQFKDPPVKEVYIRFPMSDYKKLKVIAKERHTRLSEVVRVFTLAALEEYELQAQAGGN